MDDKKISGRLFIILRIIIWGSAWGILESTAGYLLHLFSFGWGWILWYPAACFFMANVYRITHRISSVLYVGLFSACVKMLDLILPGSIDRVINPAVSIIFEATVLAAVIYAVRIIPQGKRTDPFIKAFTVLAMNTGWRMLYILYLLFLVPDWIRDVSVISGIEKFIHFFAMQNLITSLILFAGYLFMNYLFMPFSAVGRRISRANITSSSQTAKLLYAVVAALILSADVVLELLL